MCSTKWKTSRGWRNPPKGTTKPFFFRSGLAIDQNVCLDILKNNLESFLLYNYRQDDYVFWFNLVNSHYAHFALDYLKSKEISVLTKSINPDNVPKARPIGDFWGNLKVEVYEFKKMRRVW